MIELLGMLLRCDRVADFVCAWGNALWVGG